MDAHARLERPELFEFLPHLQRRRRKADKALQRLPSIGVEPDMVVERAFAERSRGPREVERVQNPAARERRSDHLHDVGIGALLLPHDLGRDGPDIGLAFLERFHAFAHKLRIERGQIPLKIDDHIEIPLRIGGLQRLVNSVRATGMIGPGQNRLAPRTGHRVLNGLRISRDQNRTASRLHGPAPNMNNHGFASDLGQRFVRQTGGRARAGMTTMDFIMIFHALGLRPCRPRQRSLREFCQLQQPAAPYSLSPRRKSYLEVAFCLPGETEYEILLL
ncbi:MAG: hypothetical protein A49_25420 [Methyloceanibacter sp.]|nr:MAG: hypothetical protein A49_25420 [Methyloceanibacter sp.]